MGQGRREGRVKGGGRVKGLVGQGRDGSREEGGTGQDEFPRSRTHLLWFEILDELLVPSVSLARIAYTQQGPFARQREVEIGCAVGQYGG